MCNILRRKVYSGQVSTYSIVAYLFTARAMLYGDISLVRHIVFMRNVLWFNVLVRFYVV